MPTREEIESKGLYYSENLITESQHKREEIEEVIWRFLDDYDGNPAVDWAYILQHRLHSQGVVIKVDRDLPEYCRGCEVTKELFEAGYVAVEPLIEETDATL